MRILHLGKYYAPDKGGMETALRHIAEGLLDLACEVRVLVAGHGRRTVRDDLPGQTGALIRAGVAGTWNSQPLTLGLPRLLQREIASFLPDVVHLHLPNPLACWAWWRSRAVIERAGCKLAVWHHSDIVRQRLGGRLVAPLTQRCLAAAEGICVSSISQRDQAAELSRWRRGVQVIPFGIDPTPYARATPSATGPFLFVGRLVPYKGLEVLLTALSGLPGVPLDIVGDGPLREHLVGRIAALELGDRVHLRGEVPDEALPELFAQSRALVLPSRDCSETFGLILLEAMAAGLPLVTSDLPTGVRELNRPGETGWLARPGDPDDLRRALQAVLDDPDEARRRGESGRELVRESFTRGRMASALIGWYEALTGNSS